MTESDPFADWHVVSVYTDAQAVEDGVLIAINPQDRVTRAVWDYLTKHTPMTAQPPTNWPVEMMGWFRAEAIKREDALKLIAKYGKDGAQAHFDKLIRDRRALALAKGLIGKWETQARYIYDNNVSGGILSLWAVVQDEKLSELTAETSAGDKLWLMPNENGGVTLMFPDDY